MLNAPTGSGKSVIAATVANFYAATMNQKSYIICSEKILQKQYEKDFKGQPNVELLLGKANYKCDINQNVSVAQARCNVVRKLPCEKDCYYKNLRKRARLKDIVISNYAYMLTDKARVPRSMQMGSRGFVAYDEAHNVESILLNFSDITLDRDLAARYVEKYPTIDDYFKHRIRTDIDRLDKAVKAMINAGNTDATDVEFCVNQFKVIRDFHIDLHQELQIVAGQNEHAGDTQLKFLVSFILQLQSVRDQIDMMIESLSDSIWIKEIDKECTSITLKPVFCTHLFNKTLGDLGEKILFMSATCPSPKVMAETLGIKVSDIAQVQLDNPFPVENRQVFYYGHSVGVDLSYKVIDANLSKLVDQIDELLETIDEPTLIHTGNYKIANHLANKSRNKDRMIVPRTENRQALVGNYKARVEAGDNAVLVSPSLMEGLSLDDDLCRLQIVAKVPYASQADERVKIRMQLSSDWYQQQAIIKIVQACGRGVRHEEDYCTTFILDIGFEKLLRFRSLFPKWFLSSLVKVGK